jgi:hydrogenase maturation protease
VPAMENLTSPTAGLAVIGCGNLNRSDDGVGVVVARRLRRWLDDAPRAGVAVFDAGTGGLEAMFQAKGAASLIIVDACKSGSQPGSIFELPGRDLAKWPARAFSLHDFRWDHALYAGEAVFGGAFPRDVTVYLIEAASVALGLQLSPAVSDAADQVVERLKARIRVRG